LRLCKPFLLRSQFVVHYLCFSPEKELLAYSENLIVHVLSHFLHGKILKEMFMC
jgi:hypothetical protein